MARKPPAAAPVPLDDLDHTLERVALAALRPHPRNYQTHPEAEIAHLMQSLTLHGVYRNVVCACDGTLLAGHGVVEAARRLGYTHLSLKRMAYGPDDPRALQLLVGDNEIAREVVKQEDALVALLQELSRDDPTALLGTGFDEATLAALADAQGLGNGAGPQDAAAEDNYSRKIAAPIYEPKGPKPALSDLYSATRTEALIAEIAGADLPEDEKAFLRCAAQRHLLFDYKMIAEYYAHAEATTQRLMENSALIIIDFARAIELGYVKLSEAIAQQYREDYGDDV